MSSQAVRGKGCLVPPENPPPPGFDLLGASDDALKAHGLPSRPNKDVFPQRHAQWERLMSLPLNFVYPDYISMAKEESKDPPVDASIRDAPATTRGESRRWSGAVNSVLKCGDIFRHVEASWTVPGVFPTPDKWKTPTTWSNSPAKYSCGIWVGIDGYTSHDVLQAGTGLRCEVNKDGTLKHETFAWFEWYPDGKVRLTKFQVQAGDVVTVLVDYDGPNPQKKKCDGIYNGHALFVNESNSTYTTFKYEYHAKSDYRDFTGDTAEWILEGHTMPNFGATFMYNCLATTDKGEERDLDCAKLINMVRHHKRLATPKKITENILGLYWGDGTFKAHKVDAE